MTRKLIHGCLAAASIAFAITPGSMPLAHHSFAMFDHDQQIRITGKATRFQWQNPHVYIELEADDETNGHRTWTIECANTSILSRIGWRFNMISPGDELTVIVAPLRTGEAGALLKEVTLPDGSVFSNGGPAGRANLD